MEVSGQLHAPALYLPRYPLDRRYTLKIFSCKNAVGNGLNASF
jgi:hypothetical protein